VLGDQGQARSGRISISPGIWKLQRAAEKALDGVKKGASWRWIPRPEPSGDGPVARTLIPTCSRRRPTTASGTKLNRPEAPMLNRVRVVVGDAGLSARQHLQGESRPWPR